MVEPLRTRQEIDKASFIERMKVMNEKVDVPEGIKPHASDYKKGAWTNYTLEELGYWVALFVKRSDHRSNLKKREKDLHDARNYLSMMDAQLSHVEDQLYETLFLYDPILVEREPETLEKIDPPEGVDPEKPDLKEEKPNAKLCNIGD